MRKEQNLMSWLNWKSQKQKSSVDGRLQ